MNRPARRLAFPVAARGSAARGRASIIKNWIDSWTDLDREAGAVFFDAARSFTEDGAVELTRSRWPRCPRL